MKHSGILALLTFFVALSPHGDRNKVFAATTENHLAAAGESEIVLNRLGNASLQRPVKKGFITGPDSVPIYHPLCIRDFFGKDFRKEGASMNMTECAAKYAKVPVSRDRLSWVASDNDDAQQWYERFSFEPIGIANGRLEFFLTLSNTGGSGWFSNILVLGKPLDGGSDQKRILAAVINGGDRCNRGIVAARLIEPEILEWDQQITSFDVFTLDDETDWRTALFAKAFVTGSTDFSLNTKDLVAKGLLPLHPYSDLDNPAAGCVGTATFFMNLRKPEKKLKSVVLRGGGDEELLGLARYQQCFNKAVLPGKDNEITLSLGDLIALSKKFEAICMLP